MERKNLKVVFNTSIIKNHILLLPWGPVSRAVLGMFLIGGSIEQVT